MYLRTLNLGSFAALISRHFLGIQPTLFLVRTGLISEGYSEKAQQLLGLLVALGTRHEGDIHPPNSIDAVSDRDFAAEFTFCCSLIVTHLSQIAENLIIWSTPEFGFIELPDELCTSSSIMPQKKNPDLVELVRGKAGAVYGQLVNLLTTLKALPLGYNRDLQETKPPVFEVAETTRHSLQAIHMAIEGLEVNRDRMREEADDYQLLAADLAEYLAAKGVPFREAHGAVARLMKGCEEEGVTPKEMDVQKLRSFHPKFQGDVLDILTPEASVAGKLSPGGTAPANVERSA